LRTRLASSIGFKEHEVQRTKEVMVVSGVRTAIGKFGNLKDLPPTELGAIVVREALARAGVDGDQVGHVVFGNVIATEPKDLYLARVAAFDGGVSQSTPAFTVNRLCGSGLQAILSAAQTIVLGDAGVAIGGGAKNMSRAPYITPDVRFGARMGAVRLIDMMLGALNAPFHAIPMGVTTENIARKYGITRKQQDALAVGSHRRAARGIAERRFKEQIVPIKRNVKGREVVIDTDEHVRTELEPGELSSLRPVFQKENGTVTTGNASGINDAAAAVLLMSREAAEQRGLRPLARLVSYAHAGVDPRYMGIGPVPATRIALERAGLTIADLDVIEANAAFAAQACAVAHALGSDTAKVTERPRLFSRAPGRRDGCADHGEGALQTAAHRRTFCAGHDVHRRRPGHCGFVRERAMRGHHLNSDNSATNAL
jgi:acetyl-CoA C-acetyltransferase